MKSMLIVLSLIAVFLAGFMWDRGAPAPRTWDKVDARTQHCALTTEPTRCYMELREWDYKWGFQ